MRHENDGRVRGKHAANHSLHTNDQQSEHVSHRVSHIPAVHGGLLVPERVVLVGAPRGGGGDIGVAHAHVDADGHRVAAAAQLPQDRLRQRLHICKVALIRDGAEDMAGKVQSSTNTSSCLKISRTCGKPTQHLYSDLLGRKHWNFCQTRAAVSEVYCSAAVSCAEPKCMFVKTERKQR